MNKELLVNLFFKKDLNDKAKQQIIENLNTLNVKLYDHISGERYFESPQLTNKNALKRLKRDHEEVSLLCGYLDINFFMFYTSENNLDSLRLLSTGYSLKKEFYNGVEDIEFDMQRYILLMIEVTKGIELIKLEAKIEWD